MNKNLLTLKIQSQPADGPPIAYRIEDAARALGVGRTTIYRLIRDGKLRIVKVGKRSLITASELQSFLSEGGTNE